MAATAAPSLEDLPPQRGTILELHSIGDEEFDGLLVEFVRIDKESHSSTKYYCTALQDESRNMRVKAKCCRRPDIKPLALRRLLYNLAAQMHKKMENDQSYTDAENDTTRLKSLLEKDPCCVPCYILLAHLKAVDEKSDDEESDDDASWYDPNVEEAIKHMYRATGNLYAYQGVLPDGSPRVLEKNLARLLAKNYRFKSAVNVLERVQNYGADQASLAFVNEHFLLGCSAHMRAVKLQEHQQPKKCHKLLEAADHYIKAFDVAAKDEGFVGEESFKARISSYVKKLYSIITFLLGQDDHLPTQEDESTCIVLRLADRTLQACTAKDGTRVFLTDEIETNLTHLVSHGALLPSLKDHLLKDHDAGEE
ncbi:MAG: hypothetical protein SGILL_010675 [Bacillariaceae sp.]